MVEHHLGSVAIPSIQVGFSIPSAVRLTHIKTGMRRNPFYSGRFFHSKNYPPLFGVGKSRNPFYSGRFFHSSFSRTKRSAGGQRRNPFYSGRFFHSKYVVGLPRGGCIMSQSLLFRSVFPFTSVGWRGARPVKSQSLLFRSVFPFFDKL